MMSESRPLGRHNTRVGVVFGGRSAEHRVSVRSARTVVEALTEAGFAVQLLAIDRDGHWVDNASAAAAIAGPSEEVVSSRADEAKVAQSLANLTEDPPGVVFPLVHGTWGEDGTLQGLCEMCDLPYVGADCTASALAMDKRLAKAVLADAGIPVVEGQAVGEAELDADATLSGVLPQIDAPLFVKPSVGGSSVGVTRVDDRSQLAAAVREALRFDQVALVERAVQGREIECAVLGYRELKASCLGEIIPGHEFYDYSDKYLEDTARLEAPAKVDPSVEVRMRSIASRAFAVLGGSGMARVDFLLEDSGAFYVNELNTIPGFTSISMYPRLWDLSGLPLPDLVAELVEIAIARHRDRSNLSHGIRSWLDQLG